jgi:hypothetical protein
MLHACKDELVEHAYIRGHYFWHNPTSYDVKVLEVEND